MCEAPRIIYLHDFLTDEECDHLIKLAASSLIRSTVIDPAGGGNGKIDGRRTSQGMFLSRYQVDEIVKGIETRLTELTEIPLENGESMQILFYEVGGEYQPHYDFFNPGTPGEANHLLRGGQRVATIIMYLNTPLSGGETVFPIANIAVTPKKRSAVLFYNCLPTGETDPNTLHGGAPVLSGEKWIATKWFRQSKFQ